MAGGAVLGLAAGAFAGVGLGTTQLVVLEPGRDVLDALAAELAHRGRGAGHGALAVIVPLKNRCAGRGELAQAAKALDGVLLLYRRRAVKADAGTTELGLGSGVLRPAGAVCKEHHAVAARRLVGLFNAPAQAFLREQALHEGEIGLAVLHAVRAHTTVGALGQKGLQVFGAAVFAALLLCHFTPLPGGVAAVSW